MCFSTESIQIRKSSTNAKPQVENCLIDHQYCTVLRTQVSVRNMMRMGDDMQHARAWEMLMVVTSLGRRIAIAWVAWPSNHNIARCINHGFINIISLTFLAEGIQQAALQKPLALVEFYTYLNESLKHGHAAVDIDEELDPITLYLSWLYNSG